MQLCVSGRPFRGNPPTYAGVIGYGLFPCVPPADVECKTSGVRYVSLVFEAVALDMLLGDCQRLMVSACRIEWRYLSRVQAGDAFLVFNAMSIDIILILLRHRRRYERFTILWVGKLSAGL
jgi:hypothetical protein